MLQEISRLKLALKYLQGTKIDEARKNLAILENLVTQKQHTLAEKTTWSMPSLDKIVNNKENIEMFMDVSKIAVKLLLKKRGRRR